MKKSCSSGILFACVFVSISSASVNAAMILQAESVTSGTPLLGGFDISNMINQNNLSIGYVSGVSDFDAYLSLNPTDGNTSSDIVAFEEGATPVEMIFDLGDAYRVASFALWNRGEPDQGVKDFALYASNDVLFSTSTLLGNFTATAELGNAQSTEAEVFSFAPTSAAFIRMDVTSNYGSCCVSLDEVAFKASAVPVPAAIWLLFSGLLGLVGVASGKKA